uniref:Uncharacterized protein n=1 Tax=Cacopsylla melanoneura TaxID=428564 RepID=A0A8D9B2C0_9HEMI
MSFIVCFFSSFFQKLRMISPLVLLFLFSVVSCAKLETPNSSEFKPVRDVHENEQIIELDAHPELYDCRPYPQKAYLGPMPKTIQKIPAIRIDRCGAAVTNGNLTCVPTKTEPVHFRILDLVQVRPTRYYVTKHIACAWKCQQKICSSDEIWNADNCSCEYHKQDPNHRREEKLIINAAAISSTFLTSWLGFVCVYSLYVFL